MKKLIVNKTLLIISLILTVATCIFAAKLTIKTNTHFDELEIDDDGKVIIEDGNTVVVDGAVINTDNLRLNGTAELVLAKKSKVYDFDEKSGDIEEQKHTGFIDTTLNEKELPDDELIMYSGLCTWSKGTEAEGEPVEVPVKAFQILKKKKQLRIIAVYYTRDDGKFYFVLPKEADYSLGPVTSKAVNMPPKVRKFFEEWHRKHQKEWKEPTWDKV